ncbi:ABC transporter domain-containing protein [Ditylenchus destructor]|nr:ABC transporter domain-containing protein [Ditylenchus destructor]
MLQALLLHLALHKSGNLFLTALSDANLNAGYFENTARSILMSEYLLEMRNIGKEFNGVKALDGIYLKVRAGECVGLCGENGAGKSTLMKVLSGRELRASGIRDTEAAGIVIIHQELMMVPHLSVAENIFLGSEPTTGGFIDYDQMNARATELLARLKINDINVALPVYHYSGGKQQLIEIAKAINKNAKLLILDEPTSALTASETRVLLDLIKELQSARRGEILGIAGLVGAGRTELVSSLFGVWPGAHQGQVFLEGKEIKIRTPRDAVRQGICMVPEDRKRDAFCLSCQLATI